MKKLLLISCAVGMSFLGYAQQSGLTIRNGEEVKVPSYADTKGLKTDVVEWYNYVDEVSTVSSGQGFFNILFPDTAVKMEYSNGYFPVNFNSLGQIFDPKGSTWFSKTTILDSNDAYKVDSIAIPYRYYRYQTGAPDTLIIQVYKHDKLADYSLTSNQRRLKTGNYDYMTTRGSNFTTEIVELLDENDTASGSAFIVKAINVSVNPGEVMAVTWTYLPGNPYSEGDTIFSSGTVANPINRFDHFYHSDPDQFYVDGYFNAGMIVPPAVRYNNAGGWNGLYIGGIAYTNYINNNVNFFLNAVNVGIEDVNDLGFAVEQNYPNPFSSITNIEYALSSASNVNIEIFDITGKSVMVINEGLKNVGEHKVTMDASNLKNGVYYYTFRTDNGQVTKKMMVQR